MTIYKKLADLFDLDEISLREIQFDFDGCLEVLFEKDELILVVDVVTYQHSPSIEEWGLDYEVSLYGLEVIEAWDGGEEVKTEEIQKLLNKTYKL